MGTTAHLHDKPVTGTHLPNLHTHSSLREGGIEGEIEGGKNMYTFHTQNFLCIVSEMGVEVVGPKSSTAKGPRPRDRRERQAELKQKVNKNTHSIERSCRALIPVMFSPSTISETSRSRPVSIAKSDCSSVYCKSFASI